MEAREGKRGKKNLSNRQGKEGMRWNSHDEPSHAD